MDQILVSVCCPPPNEHTITASDVSHPYLHIFLRRASSNGDQNFVPRGLWCSKYKQVRNYEASDKLHVKIYTCCIFMLQCTLTVPFWH